MKKLFYIFFIILSIYQISFGQISKRNIAVIDFDARGGTNYGESGVLTDRLRAIIVRRDYFNVVDRGKMEAILSEVGFQQTGCTSKECAVEVGKILNAELMITGTIGKLGELYTIDIILIEVETARIIKSITREYEGKVENILPVMEKVADDIIDILVSTFGSLNVTTEPVSAEIWIDNKKIRNSPSRIDSILMGIHNVKFIAEGYAPFEDKVTIEKGRITHYKAKLKKISTLKINSFPQGAKVNIKNPSISLEDLFQSSMRLTPYTQEVIEGTKFTLQLKKENYEDWVQDILVTQDTTINISMEYKIGSLSVNTEPISAEIFLDNKKVGHAPLKIDSILVGKHTIKLVSGGYATLEDKVVIEKAKILEYKAKLKKIFTLKVNSFPEGAKVYIKNPKTTFEDLFKSTSGLTPYTQQAVEGTKFTLQLKKENYEDWVQDILVTQDTTINISMEYKIGSLNIVTDPTPAKILLDGKYIGDSPLEIDSILVGIHKIKLMADGYVSLENNVTVQKGKVTEYKTRLKKDIAKMSFISELPASIFIDGKDIGKPPVNDYNVSTGYHEVVFKIESDSVKKLILRNKVIKIEPEETQIVSLVPYTKKEILIMSSILPGSGQVASGREIFGLAYFASFVGNTALLLVSFETNSFELGIISLAILGGVYGINLLDAYISNPGYKITVTTSKDVELKPAIMLNNKGEVQTGINLQW
jgi:hypothetical protein